MSSNKKKKVLLYNWAQFDEKDGRWCNSLL